MCFCEYGLLERHNMWHKHDKTSKFPSCNFSSRVKCVNKYVIDYINNDEHALKKCLPECSRVDLGMTIWLIGVRIIWYDSYLMNHSLWFIDYNERLIRKGTIKPLSLRHSIKSHGHPWVDYHLANVKYYDVDHALNEQLMEARSLDNDWKSKS